MYPHNLAFGGMITGTEMNVSVSHDDTFNALISFWRSVTGGPEVVA